MESYLLALFGGMLIGLAAAVLWLGLGRVAGISGILSTMFLSRESKHWRASFIAGLIVGGFVVYLVNPSLFQTMTTSSNDIWIAGLLVGFGTTVGSGCTSGHGVCGISRLSKRSIVATVIFMVTGMLTVYLKNKAGA